MRVKVKVALRPHHGSQPADGSREAPEARRITTQKCNAIRSLLFLLTIFVSLTAFAAEPVQIKIRDLATVEGVRENPLIGYGMIVGLNGTGDKQQTVFAKQALAGILQRIGVQIPTNAGRVTNVASEFLTANL